MNNDRLVIEIPLKQIWTDTGIINAFRSRYIDSKEIKNLLSKHPVKFVIANIGEKLKWISTDQCYVFWKTEAQNHMVDDIDKINLEKYPKNYAYIASDWIGEIQYPIILFEKIH